VAPSFVEDRRRAALEVYESQELPTWRRSGFWTTTLRGLDLDALEPKRYDSLDSAIVRDHLGDEDHAAESGRRCPEPFDQQRFAHLVDLVDGVAGAVLCHGAELRHRLALARLHDRVADCALHVAQQSQQAAQVRHPRYL